MQSSIWSGSDTRLWVLAAALQFSTWCDRGCGLLLAMSRHLAALCAPRVRVCQLPSFLISGQRRFGTVLVRQSASNDQPLRRRPPAHLGGASLRKVTEWPPPVWLRFLVDVRRSHPSVPWIELMEIAGELWDRLPLHQLQGYERDFEDGFAVALKNLERHIDSGRKPLVRLNVVKPPLPATALERFTEEFYATCSNTRRRQGVNQDLVLREWKELSKERQAIYEEAHLRDYEKFAVHLLEFHNAVRKAVELDRIISFLPSRVPVFRDPERPIPPMLTFAKFVKDTVLPGERGISERVMKLWQQQQQEVTEERKEASALFYKRLEEYVKSGKEHSWIHGEKPLRPVTAYQRFFLQFKFMEQGLTKQEKHDLVGSVWKGMTEEQQRPWRDRWAAEKADFERQMSVYKISGKHEQWQAKVGISDELLKRMLDYIQKKTKHIKKAGGTKRRKQVKSQKAALVRMDTGEVAAENAPKHEVSREKMPSPVVPVGGDSASCDLRVAGKAEATSVGFTTQDS